MMVYLDERILGTDSVSEIQEQFPTLIFVTNPLDAFAAEVLIMMPDFFRRYEIESFQNVRWIQFLMAGYDAFDFSMIQDWSIQVTNAQDIFSTSIAEDVLTKIFVLNRNVKHYLQSMESRDWKPIRKEPELIGKTAGILGTGSIGREVAKRLKAFEMKTVGYRRTIKATPFFDEVHGGNSGLEHVIRVADYLIVALPLNAETKHLINRERLQLMKTDALFINVARGDIVDQDALVDALRLGWIRGAGLDVTSPEPLPKNHPLWDFPHVYITPHNASSSPYMQQRLLKMIVENLTRYLNKETLMYQVFD